MEGSNNLPKLPNFQILNDFFKSGIKYIIKTEKGIKVWPNKISYLYDYGFFYKRGIIYIKKWKTGSNIIQHKLLSLSLCKRACAPLSLPLFHSHGSEQKMMEEGSIQRSMVALIYPHPLIFF